MFEPDGDATIARDRVDYELRGSDVLQDVAQSLLVRRDLERIFGYRGDRLAELYPAA
jgi:ligand-binding SRPBCC domain-containing protein